MDQETKNLQIPMDKVEQGLSDKNTIQVFAQYFLEEVTEGFKSTYRYTWAKTRGKIRSNLESYVLGFEGSTENAEWSHEMWLALDRTFTRKVPIDGEEKMLSDVLGLEGEGKAAFDKIMMSMPEILLRQSCRNEKETGIPWELDASDCFDCVEGKESCLWNLFVNAVGKERFQSYDGSKSVLEWLVEIHRFSAYKGLKESVTDLFVKVLTKEVPPRCKEYNKEVEREGTV